MVSSTRVTLGIRSSDNVNIAALVVLNASNIVAAGKVTGIPVIEAPNIGALTSASNVAGAATKATEAPNDSGGKNDHPSIIIVEVLGYGGTDADRPLPRRDQQDRRSQDPNSPVQVIGGGELTPAQRQKLTITKRWSFAEP